MLEQDGQQEPHEGHHLRENQYLEDPELIDIGLAYGTTQALRGYLATPSGDGPWPGLVLVHEVFGLDEVMRRHADRLARAGYLTLAVDLFSAGGRLHCLVSTMRAMIKREGSSFADIETARTWLIRSTQCTNKIGVIGFCMGGGFALLVANRGFDVSAPNYGRLPRDLENALRGTCPIVASYGGRDRSLKNAAAKLEVALSEAGVDHDVREYRDAGHAFLNDAETGPKMLRPLLKVMGVGPNPEAAADAWERIETFFARHLDSSTIS